MVPVTRWLLPLAVVGGAAANLEVQMSLRLCFQLLWEDPRIGVWLIIRGVCVTFVEPRAVPTGCTSVPSLQHEEASSFFTPLL